MLIGMMSRSRGFGSDSVVLTSQSTSIRRLPSFLTTLFPTFRLLEATLLFEVTEPIIRGLSTMFRSRVVKTERRVGFLIVD